MPSSNVPPRVLVCDEQPLVRAGLRALLDERVGIAVVGEAANCGEALAAVGRLLPDILLLDFDLPAGEGVNRTRLLEGAGAAHPVRVIALLRDGREERLLVAVRSGVRALLLKSGATEHIVRAVHAVAEGHALIAPSLAAPLLDRLAEHLRAAAAATTPSTGLEQLTQRERQVLELLAQGWSNAELASALGLREATVRSHVHNVLTKLGLQHRSQAIAFAYQTGLVNPAGTAT